LTSAALVAERLEAVRARIRLAGGDEKAVKVVAVTKGFGTPVLWAAAAAGLADFGENYAQELLSKLPGAPPQARWHFLGELQRNKLARLAPHVFLWQALDRADRAAQLAQRRPGAAVLVQVKVAGGPGRHGAPAEEVPTLVERSRSLGLDVRGLMAVGPARAPEAESRRCFRQVADLARSLGLEELSMGMSDDLEAAVSEGATMVRLGRALFGARP
jgi:pyridoxal phosphate enzyme (YggS family)